MSERSGTNPFSSDGAQEIENKHATVSNMNSHTSPTAEIYNDTVAEQDQRDDDSCATKLDSCLGPSIETAEKDNTGQPIQTDKSSGLNPFLSVGTSIILISGHDADGDGNETIQDIHQQQGEVSNETERVQVFSYGPLLPKINCKEKIIICVDLSSEFDQVPFMGRDGTQYKSSALLRNVLNCFVQTKNSMNPLHEFALVALRERAVWLHDFNNDTDEVLADLHDLMLGYQSCDEFDMTSLFELLHDKVQLPSVEGDVESLPPPYIVRTIMIYGRSKCIPKIEERREVCDYFLKSPYFFMDVFYIHEPPTEENCCKEVYDVFLDVDVQNRAYINEVGRNITQLHDKMAMLLAHPLQRPYQQHCHYNLQETNEDL